MTANGNEYQCQIRDQGSGIPEAIQKTLFQPHKTTKSKGSGMGLYMAQKLAENRYQGQIEMLRSDTEGTVIQLNLHQQRRI